MNSVDRLGTRTVPRNCSSEDVKTIMGYREADAYAGHGWFGRLLLH
jgi:hypothetical protein